MKEAVLPLPPSRFAAALQEASQVDKLIEEEPGGEEVLADRLPLLGVPLSVKESFALQGTAVVSAFVNYMREVNAIVYEPLAKGLIMI